VPLVSLPLPEKTRGAERRQALVRKRRTRWSVSRADPSPRTLRDDRPMTRTGAPFGALPRRLPYGVGPRFLRRSFAPLSASSWQEAVVPPSGAPTPPECEGANLARGRRSSQGPELPGAGCRIPGPVLRSRLRPAPRSRRLMSAPLCEQGASMINAVLAAGITFFSKTYPRDVEARVPGAAQHGAKRSGAPQTRDPGFCATRRKQPGSRICGAPLARCTACGTRALRLLHRQIAQHTLEASKRLG
jgi:hypothetical protein